MVQFLFHVLAFLACILLIAGFVLLFLLFVVVIKNLLRDLGG